MTVRAPQWLQQSPHVDRCNRIGYRRHLRVVYYSVPGALKTAFAYRSRRPWVFQRFDDNHENRKFRFPSITLNDVFPTFAVIRRAVLRLFDTVMRGRDDSRCCYRRTGT